METIPTSKPLTYDERKSELLKASEALLSLMNEENIVIGKKYEELRQKKIQLEKEYEEIKRKHTDIYRSLEADRNKIEEEILVISNTCTCDQTLVDKYLKMPIEELGGIFDEYRNHCKFYYDIARVRKNIQELVDKSSHEYNCNLNSCDLCDTRTGCIYKDDKNKLALQKKRWDLQIQVLEVETEQEFGKHPLFHKYMYMPYKVFKNVKIENTVLVKVYKLRQTALSRAKRRQCGCTGGQVCHHCYIPCDRMYD